MRIHHVNAATLCPLGRKLVNGDGGLFERGRLVCHCLIVEGPDGLVLVDTGLGTRDIARPAERLGARFVSMTKPLCSEEETMRAHVRRLGFSERDVRHIVVTHLDLDHAGGLADFPHATVHVHRREHAAAMARATYAEASRYRPEQLNHATWALHDEEGERWMGFGAVRALDASDDVLLVPLFGHTRGHTGVAIRGEHGWLLHAGDAYMARGDLIDDGRNAPAGLALYQRLVAMDDEARRANVERLRELHAVHPEITVFSAHCPLEFARDAR